MARAALYCRVSTEEQSEHGFGLDAQRRILTEYCQREGHSAEFFVDAGISGETISARPELQQLLREVKAGRLTSCLLWTRIGSRGQAISLIGKLLSARFARHTFSGERRPLG